MKLCISLLLALLFTTHAYANSLLVIGDSHSVGPFGSELHRLLQENEKISAVSSYASCGSIAKWWRNNQETPCGYWQHSEGEKPITLKTAPTPNFSNLLEKHKPVLVVIELSGNYYRMNEAFAIADMKQMAEEVQAFGAKCLWVSTPKTRKDSDRLDGLLHSVREAIDGTCTHFESHLVTDYPEMGGDGIHYSFPAGIPIAKNWARLVALEVEKLILFGKNPTPAWP